MQDFNIALDDTETLEALLIREPDTDPTDGAIEMVDRLSSAREAEDVGRPSICGCGFPGTPPGSTHRESSPPPCHSLIPRDSSSFMTRCVHDALL